MNPACIADVAIDGLHYLIIRSLSNPSPGPAEDPARGHPKSLCAKFRIRIRTPIVEAIYIDPDCNIDGRPFHEKLENVFDYFEQRCQCGIKRTCMFPRIPDSSTYRNMSDNTPLKSIEFCPEVWATSVLGLESCNHLVSCDGM